MAEAKTYYLEQDYNCAESVLRILNDTASLNLPEEALKLVGGYGAGLGCGKTCGALCGALAAYSAQQILQRAHEDPSLKDRCADFVKLFAETLGDTDCSAVRPKYFQDGQRCLAVVEKTAELMLAYMKK